MQPTPKEIILVKTTLPAVPLPPSTSQPLHTQRLTLRPYAQDDLPSIHALRSQPEVMHFTASGKPEPLEKTRKFLEGKFQNAGKVNLDYVVCLRETGEFIGLCGSHQRRGYLGWPAIGYQFRKEAWGKGYGTEAVRALMEAYWALSREECEISVDKSTVRESAEGGLVQECVFALTEEANAGSRNVLTKCGFELEKTWIEPDLRDETVDIELFGYIARRK